MNKKIVFSLFGVVIVGLSIFLLRGSNIIPSIKVNDQLISNDAVVVDVDVIEADVDAAFFKSSSISWSMISASLVSSSRFLTTAVPHFSFLICLNKASDSADAKS